MAPSRPSPLPEDAAEDDAAEEPSVLPSPSPSPSPPLFPPLPAPLPVPLPLLPAAADEVEEEAPFPLLPCDVAQPSEPRNEVSQCRRWTRSPLRRLLHVPHAATAVFVELVLAAAASAAVDLLAFVSTKATHGGFVHTSAVLASAGRALRADRVAWGRRGRGRRGLVMRLPVMRFAVRGLTAVAARHGGCDGHGGEERDEGDGETHVDGRWIT